MQGQTPHTEFESCNNILYKMLEICWYFKSSTIKDLEKITFKNLRHANEDVEVARIKKQIGNNQESLYIIS